MCLGSSVGASVTQPNIPPFPIPDTLPAQQSPSLALSNLWPGDIHVGFSWNPKVKELMLESESLFKMHGLEKAASSWA